MGRGKLRSDVVVHGDVERGGPSPHAMLHIFSVLSRGKYTVSPFGLEDHGNSRYEIWCYCHWKLPCSRI